MNCVHLIIPRKRPDKHYLDKFEIFSSSLHTVCTQFANVKAEWYCKSLPVHSVNVSLALWHRICDAETPACWTVEWKLSTSRAEIVGKHYILLEFQFQSFRGFCKPGCRWLLEAHLDIFAMFLWHFCTEFAVAVSDIALLYVAGGALLLRLMMALLRYFQLREGAKKTPTI